MNLSDFIFWIFCFKLFDVRIHVHGAVLAPARRVLARPGEAAVLPCRLRPQQDMTAFTVEWSKEDGRGRHDYILIYRRGAQRATGAMATSLFLDRLGAGDISLEVFNVTPADSGTYRCAVPKLGGGGGGTAATLELIVDPDYKHSSTTAPPLTPPSTPTPPPGGGSTDTVPAGPGSEPKMAAVTVAIVIVFVIVLVIVIVALVFVVKRQQKLRKQDSLTFAARSCWTSPTDQDLDQDQEDPEPVLQVFLARG